ncbi:aspartate--ammonia ligase [Silvanigrella paludirubra]|uniref:Aspartate--ammonia ligase n=1 Tax=Silvanigrella paludirubra TaxID=2499159 RepID=A0A6N6VUG6_9BACT|nr:aspartate--ammonia ligase [Silvanigrella paludirubra]KAB8039985.1 aspartate--ammonia ligase [Silvanigrella paludirubra]
MSICVLSCESQVVSASELKKVEKQIHFVKTFFPQKLSDSLSLLKVSAPLFVEKGTGINDDLNGIESPVSFKIPEYSELKTIEVVQSLAKWKRMMLKIYDFPVGEGLYTDMRAIRPSDKIDPTHSAYVDQWDWEITISKEQRNLSFLKETVEKIYKSIKETEMELSEKFSDFRPILPEKITFIHSEELLDLYPHLSPYDREREICKKHGAVFLIGIGGKLKNGQPHDGRAPDYDDWTTETSEKFKGLNGDILVWHPQLEFSFELSSMGIRVDRDALLKQLSLTGQESRLQFLFHSMLEKGELPLSLGGGIGQSRLAMFLLNKRHISQVQASVF